MKCVKYSPLKLLFFLMRTHSSARGHDSPACPYPVVALFLRAPTGMIHLRADVILDMTSLTTIKEDIALGQKYTVL
jgi:hypothetical protein